MRCPGQIRWIRGPAHLYSEVPLAGLQARLPEYASEALLRSSSPIPRAAPRLTLGGLASVGEGKQGMSRSARVACEDVLLFVNAAITSTAQREFRAFAEGQRLSLAFVREYVLGQLPGPLHLGSRARYK